MVSMWVALMLAAGSGPVPAPPGQSSEVVLVLDTSCSMAVPFQTDQGKTLPPNDPDRAAVLGVEIVQGLTKGSGDAVTVVSFGESQDASPHQSSTPDEVKAFGADKDAIVWNCESGERITTLSGHTRSLLDSSYNFDGRRIVTASTDTTARLWDADTGQPLQILTGHTQPVRVARFSTDATRVVTASDQGYAKLFARAILSWFPLRPGTPLAAVSDFLVRITEPVLAPLRKVLPKAGMLDLSFLVLMVFLLVLLGFLGGPG